MTNEPQRAAFEAFMSDEGKFPQAIERDANGNYVLMQTASSWHVWQAAIALDRQQRGEPEIPDDTMGRLYSGRGTSGDQMIVWRALRALNARDTDGRMSDAMRDFITGMSVSIDVSTCDDDAGNRYFGTVTEVMDADDKHRVTLLVQDAEPNFTTPQPAAPTTKESLTVAEPVRVVSGKTPDEYEHELDELGEQCNRLQNALAFYMPDVPEFGHPLHKRIAHDAYLLFGYEGSADEEPSAQALGLITLAEQSAQPAASAGPATKIGRVDVVDGRVKGYGFEQTDIPTGSYYLHIAPVAAQPKNKWPNDWAEQLSGEYAQGLEDGKNTAQPAASAEPARWLVAGKFSNDSYHSDLISAQREKEFRGDTYDGEDETEVVPLYTAPVAAQPIVLADWRAKVQAAYGHLWMVNNEPGTPNQYAPDKAAYEARKLLRGLLTKEDRGDGINAAMLAAAPTLPDGRAQQDADKVDVEHIHGLLSQFRNATRQDANDGGVENFNRARDIERELRAEIDAIAGKRVQPASGEDARDAVRYRWLKECNGGAIGIVAWHRNEEEEMILVESHADAAIDAAIQQGGQS